MLVCNIREIGERLLTARKKAGLTQAEVAELASLSDRAYADIERGVTNMRVETLLRICKALKITPDEILVKEPPEFNEDESFILSRIEALDKRDKKTALHLLQVYMNSLMH